MIKHVSPPQQLHETPFFASLLNPIMPAFNDHQILSFLDSAETEERMKSLDTWEDDVIRVKALFAEGEYKRCAIVCGDCSKNAKSPVHKAFLKLYEAICHEIMGVAAHAFSASKLPLLYSAQDAYQSALSSLDDARKVTKVFTPLRFASQAYKSRLPQKCEWTNSYDGIVREFEFLDLQERVAAVAAAAGVGDGQNINTPSRTPVQVTGGNLYGTQSCTPGVQHRRPSNVARMFTPTPLPKVDQTKTWIAPVINGSPEIHPIKRHREHDLPATSDEEHNVIYDRPLPPLPFDHNPRFEKKRGRHRLVSAQQSRSTNSAEAWNQSGEQHEEEQLPQGLKTPVTPRFQYIAHALCPVYSGTPFEKLSLSEAQGCYHESLSSLRHCVLDHLSTTLHRIKCAIETQQERNASRKGRIASFWSFEPAHLDKSTQPKPNPVKERIQKLKAQGWQVRKEKHGWKGQEYYDRLRMEAENDLTSRYQGSKLAPSALRGTRAVSAPMGRKRRTYS